MKTEDNRIFGAYDVLFYPKMFSLERYTMYISVDTYCVSLQKMQEDHQSIIVFIATNSQQSTVKVGSVGHP